jgi:hypothetical protein
VERNLRLTRHLRVWRPPTRVRTHIRVRAILLRRRRRVSGTDVRARGDRSSGSVRVGALTVLVLTLSLSSVCGLLLPITLLTGLRLTVRLTSVPRRLTGALSSVTAARTLRPSGLLLRRLTLVVVAIARLLLRRRRRRVRVRVRRGVEAGRRAVRGGGRLPSALRRCRLLLTGLLLLLSVILTLTLILTLILRGGPPRRRRLLLRLFSLLRRPSGRHRRLSGRMCRAVVVVLRRRRRNAGWHRYNIRRVGRVTSDAGLTCGRRADRRKCARSGQKATCSTRGTRKHTRENAGRGRRAVLSVVERRGGGCSGRGRKSTIGEAGEIGEEATGDGSRRVRIRSRAGRVLAVGRGGGVGLEQVR